MPRFCLAVLVRREGNRGKGMNWWRRREGVGLRNRRPPSTGGGDFCSGSSIFSPPFYTTDGGNKPAARKYILDDN